MLTPEQFDALAKLTRAREPARLAARRVLVDGISQADAARELGISPSALGNSVRRYREFDSLIRDAYQIRD
ncbi:TrfB-related DNA-binding protein [Diaphorobacter sp. J5-51]|uniref:TrfB-related DNA-binding protein n=1 Tax=Diaphorobacter sp. J5-51 TaxID=680496 RepID=UPI0018FEC288